MEFFDRVPTYPGRVRMTPVPGQANTYDIVRADNPIEVGTPINKVLFDSYTNRINAVVQAIDNKIFALTQRVPIGNLSDGTVFGLYENGILVPYIKAKGSYSGPSRDLVVRLDCFKLDTLRNTSDAKGYANCKTDRWLNGEFLSVLDAATQSMIAEIEVDLSANSNANTYLMRKAFLLSGRELGLAQVFGLPNNGYEINYFTADSARAIARFNGTPVAYWTRSASTYDDSGSFVTVSGVSSGADTTTELLGIRPAFTLPAEYEVTVGNPNTANTMATAEVI